MKMDLFFQVGGSEGEEDWKFRMTQWCSISLKTSTTLQGINISHLGKRKIIFKMPFLGDMLVPRRVPGKGSTGHFESPST